MKASAAAGALVARILAAISMPTPVARARGRWRRHSGGGQADLMRALRHAQHALPARAEQLHGEWKRARNQLKRERREARRG